MNDLKQTLTISDLQFPVNLENLYFGNGETKKRKVYGYKCLINSLTKSPISIVSNGYRIITHQEAYNLGIQCMQKLFDITESEISIFKIITTSNSSAVFIDLIHKSYEINVFQEEIYLPYLRITNSYNKTRALRFDLGFVRKLCLNGCIFEQNTIRFQFPHVKKKNAETLKFEIPTDKWINFKNEFTGYIQKVKVDIVEQKQMFPLFLKAINYNIENIYESKESENRFERTKTEARQILNKYSTEFNNSIYTVFNAATDYASSRRNKDNSESIQINGLQRKCGNWLTEYILLKSKNDFNLQTYLGSYSNFSFN